MIMIKYAGKGKTCIPNQCTDATRVSYEMLLWTFHSSMLTAFHVTVSVSVHLWHDIEPVPMIVLSCVYMGSFATQKSATFIFSRHDVCICSFFHAVYTCTRKHTQLRAQVHTGTHGVRTDIH